MFAVLPLLSLIVLFFIFSQTENEWRSSALLAALTWGLFVAFSTEVLSVFRLLYFPTLLIFWSLTNVCLVFTYLKLNKKGKHVGSIHLPKSSFLIFLLGSIIFIVAVVGLIALVAPPNNWDSMTYHMSRVVHWIQNRSVNHYPTHILRQLYSGPWAGYAITHLQILSGGDRFANLIQWFSMLGSILGVSLIAAQLGANLRGQIFAAVVCATIPMGILQGSSTQTDYVVSFWLVCFVYFVLLTIQDKINPKHIPKVAASLGLALLTKGTAYVYAFPFCIWLLVSGVKRLGIKVWQPILVAGGIILAINSGYYLRNFELFGSVLGASEGQGNKAISLPMFVSNVIRNLALHLSTPVRSINLITIRFVELLHKFLGLDVSDPRITSPPGQNFDLHSLINHEDLAGNLFHLLLTLFTIIYFFTTWRWFKNRQKYFLTTYITATGAGFLLFCWLITWSPWRSRVHLPFFVLTSVFIGVILSRVLILKFANLLVTLLIFSSFIWVLFNESRPVVLSSQIVENNRIENIFNHSRIDQYFINKPELLSPYIDAVNFVDTQQCSKIGLYLNGDSWEYPFWILLQNISDKSLQIKHMNITNISAIKTQKSSQEFVPCAIIASETEESKELVAASRSYTQKWSGKPVSVFLSDAVSSKN